MARKSSKGCALALEVASVFTAITQLTSIGIDGAEVETFEVKLLNPDTPFVENPVSGWVMPGNASFEGFYDPALASHQALAACLSTPAEQNWRWTYPDATVQNFSGGGVSLGVTAASGEGLKFSGGVKISGDPGFSDGGT